MAGTKTTVSRGQPPIDRAWAWMICLGFFLFVFFMVGLAKSYGLILEALINEFGVSTATATLPMSVTLLVYAFGAPTAILIAERFTIQKVVVVGSIIGFAGIAFSSLLYNIVFFIITFAPTAILIAERFTIQKVVVVGSIIGFAGIAFSSLLYNIVFFIITFGLFYGMGNSCFYGNGMIMIGRYFKHRRSLANGLALSGASIGQFVLPPLVEYLLGNYGLSGTLLLISALYLHGAVSGLLFRPIEQYEPVTEKMVPSAEEEKQMVKYEAGNEKVEDCNGGNYDEKKLLSLKENPERTAHLLNGDAEHGKAVGWCGVNKKSPLDIVDSDADDEEENLDREKRMIFGSQGSIFMVSTNSPDTANTQMLPMNGKSKQIKSSVFKIIDFSLLKNYVTLFITAVSFLCFLGYFNFILFLPSIVKEKGIEKYDKAFLISISGIGDLIARISVGFFADLNLIPRYKIKATACLLCGINIFMFVFADSFAWLAVHCFLYGFLGGAYVCMIAVVIVDLVGLASMGRNLAVVLFIQGIGSSAGNPVLGRLKDITGSFVIVSVVCSLSLCLGAILLFTYPLIKRLDAKRAERLRKL